ncbi:MAG TPA: hypothetical protein VJ801_14485 [Polyangia bacterium]|nr:hypothetical protein [Polyangia bacterium]
MAAANPVTLKLRALLEKLTLDLAAAEGRAAEVAGVLSTSRGHDPDRGGVAITAVALDHYYTSIESSLEAIRRVFDSMAPAGADWHRALLASVSTGTTTRPSVLSPETSSDLKDLLAFRHFLRHAYATDLEWKRMCDVAAALGNTHRQVKGDLEAFRGYVARCLAEAEGEPDT